MDVGFKDRRPFVPHLKDLVSLCVQRPSSSD